MNHEMQRGRNYPGGGLYVQPGAVSSQQLEQLNERQNIQLDSQPTWCDLVCSIDLVDASFNMSYYVYYMSPYFCSWGESWLDNPFQGTWKRSLKPSQATCLAECFPILKHVISIASQLSSSKRYWSISSKSLLERQGVVELSSPDTNGHRCGV